ncbi:hypothetical protein OROGR_014339 [Orobanche gracilis]
MAPVPWLLNPRLPSHHKLPPWQIPVSTTSTDPYLICGGLQPFTTDDLSDDEADLSYLGNGLVRRMEDGRSEQNRLKGSSFKPAAMFLGGEIYVHYCPQPPHGLPRDIELLLSFQQLPPDWFASNMTQEKLNNLVSIFCS